MTRKSIKVDYEFSLEDLKDAVNTYLMYEDVHNRDTDTLKFKFDEEGTVIGATVDVWF